MERVDIKQARVLARLGCNIEATAEYRTPVVCLRDSREFVMREPCLFEKTGKNDTYLGVSYTDFIDAPYLDEVIDWFDEQGIVIAFHHCVYVGELGEMALSWSVAIIEVAKLNEYSFTAPTIIGIASRTEAKIAGIERAIEIIKESKNEQ